MVARRPCSGRDDNSQVGFVGNRPRYPEANRLEYLPGLKPRSRETSSSLLDVPTLKAEASR